MFKTRGIINLSEGGQELRELIGALLKRQRVHEDLEMQTSLQALWQL